ncbi:18967_t:CDS:2, partial [Racocetra fulgida]
FNYLLQFALCAMCHSSFQRKKSSKNHKSYEFSHNIPNDLDTASKLSNVSDSDLDNFSDETIDNLSNSLETKKVSFSLSVKLVDKVELPSKFIEIYISSIEDLLSEVYNYLIILLENNAIPMDDYFIAYKFEKTSGAGIQLKDSNDFKKFILDNDKAIKEKKSYNYDSSADEIKIKSKKQKTIPKESSLSEAEKLHGQYINGIGSIEVPPTHPIFNNQHTRNNNDKPKLQNDAILLSNNNNPQAMQPIIIPISYPLLQTG